MAMASSMPALDAQLLIGIDVLLLLSPWMSKLYKSKASPSAHSLVTYHIDQNGKKCVFLDALASVSPRPEATKRLVSGVCLYKLCKLQAHICTCRSRAGFCDVVLHLQLFFTF